MDGNGLSIPLLPVLCYLCEGAVTELREQAYSSHPRNQIRDRRSTGAVEGYGLLGCWPTGVWREGDAKGPQGFSGNVSPGWRRIATAEVHHRPYGRITLPMARAQAQKIFAARLDGRHPAEEKKQSRRRLVVDRIDDLIEAFIHEHISQTVSRNRISNLLRRDVVPHWGAKGPYKNF